MLERGEEEEGGGGGEEVHGRVVDERGVSILVAVPVVSWRNPGRCDFDWEAA